MRKFTKIIVPFLLAILVLLPVTQADQVAAASKYEDGEYSLSFNVLKENSDDRSIAADYMKSPAKLIVKDGKNLVQITLTSASYWQDFSVSSSSVKTISDGADTRLVQFEVGDLDQIVTGSMHVVVPDIDYDSKYNVRFQFDTSNLPGASGSDDEKTEEENGEDKSTEDGTAVGEKGPEENPPTGDSAPILLLTVVLLASGLMLVRKVAFK